ncbi:MAG: TetR family transcriptional regulator C-terminal domain-containing protein [Cyclobacteriaceae bacterium]
MEKTTAKTKTRAVSKAALQKAFIEHLLTHDKNPVSIFDFTKKLKATETDFYKHFNSFKSLERSIWLDWFIKTTSTLAKDEAFAQYSVREKFLAFYFTWFEVILPNRSYVIYRLEKMSKKDLNPFFLFSLKDGFEEFVSDLMAEGKETDEVAERPFARQYEKAFWLHFMFINKFWADDDSEAFEKTDAAIEKSVNLGLDLVGKGPLDSMIDFAKFLFQNKKPF